MTNATGGYRLGGASGPSCYGLSYNLWGRELQAMISEQIWLAKMLADYRVERNFRLMAPVPLNTVWLVTSRGKGDEGPQIY